MSCMAQVGYAPAFQNSGLTLQGKGAWKPWTEEDTKLEKYLLCNIFNLIYLMDVTHADVL